MHTQFQVYCLKIIRDITKFYEISEQPSGSFLSESTLVIIQPLALQQIKCLKYKCFLGTWLEFVPTFSSYLLSNKSQL